MSADRHYGRGHAPTDAPRWARDTAALLASPGPAGGSPGALRVAPGYEIAFEEGYEPYAVFDRTAAPPFDPRFRCGTGTSSTLPPSIKRCPYIVLPAFSPRLLLIRGYPSAPTSGYGYDKVAWALALHCSGCAFRALLGAFAADCPHPRSPDWEATFGRAPPARPPALSSVLYRELHKRRISEALRPCFALSTWRGRKASTDPRQRIRVQALYERARRELLSSRPLARRRLGRARERRAAAGEQPPAPQPPLPCVDGCPCCRGAGSGAASPERPPHLSAAAFATGGGEGGDGAAEDIDAEACAAALWWLPAYDGGGGPGGAERQRRGIAARANEPGPGADALDPSAHPSADAAAQGLEALWAGALAEGRQESPSAASAAAGSEAPLPQASEHSGGSGGRADDGEPIVARPWSGAGWCAPPPACPTSAERQATCETRKASARL